MSDCEIVEVHDEDLQLSELENMEVLFWQPDSSFYVIAGAVAFAIAISFC